jgi:hypothetical protein
MSTMRKKFFVFIVAIVRIVPEAVGPVTAH